VQDGARRGAKPAVSAGTSQASVNSAITSAGFTVGTVSTTSTTNSGAVNTLATALTDTTVTLLRSGY
jgi:hypothetical protein